MDRNGVDPLGDLLTGELGDLTDETKDGWFISEAVFAGCKFTIKILKFKKKNFKI